VKEKRVIVVGPSNGILRGAAATLEHAGYDVASVESPEILETFGAGPPPDLLLVDAAFGPDGGVAVCRTLRENIFWRNVSLMLAVPAGEQHLEECLIAGINDFIVTPFPADELVDKARRLTVIPTRREMNTLVKLRERADDSAPLLGKTLNVSNNGLLVEIETLLNVGRLVDLEFFLPGDPELVRCRGHVIRRASELDLFHPAFGIRFSDLPEKERVRIETFVTNREQRGEAPLGLQL